MNFDSSRCIVIGEVGQAHDGSLGMAHAYIDAIARAGADAVKFQTHIASAESTLSEPWRVKFSCQDATRYEYWKRMEFTREQWLGLKRHAEERNLQFLSSPFSVEAAQLLSSIGVRAWKIASGELTNSQLCDYLIVTRLPVLVSTGMSSIAEIDRLVDSSKAGGCPVAVLQCTSAYPCPPEKVGLNLIPWYRQRYNCAVGLSDHSGSIFPGLSAAALGIEVLEVHVTLSRECFGPDTAASLTTQELATLIQGVRYIEIMRANPVDKDEIADEMAPIRKLFTKSVVARVDLPAGTILTRACLGARKPGTGIAAERLQELVGRRLRRPLSAGDFLQESDLRRESDSSMVAG